jgi:hypothetical protein
MRYGADSVEIIDEDGKVTVKPFKTRDELKAILREHNVDAIPFEVSWRSLNPFRRWRKKTP